MGQVRFAARSDRGQMRPSNQDIVHAALAPADRVTSHGHLFLVADGMGGYAGGEIASAMARELVLAHYYASSLTPAQDPGPGLRAALQHANHAIHERGAVDTACFHMGTTCTVVALRGERFWIGHAGDSRCYFWQAGRLRQLTEDHNLAGSLVAQGKLRPEEAPHHTGRNMLTRALGLHEDLAPDVLAFPEPLTAGDRVLLCSDGLNRVLDDKRIAMLLGGGDVEAVVEQIIAETNGGGAPDNVSVVLVERTA